MKSLTESRAPLHMLPINRRSGIFISLVSLNFTMQNSNWTANFLHTESAQTLKQIYDNTSNVYCVTEKL
jgi:hypothetical protein